jgi:hypothetical protein
MKPILALVAVSSLVAAIVWARSTRRLFVVWRRVEGERGPDADVTVLARSAFRKDLHTTCLYAVLAIAAAGVVVAGENIPSLLFVLILVPVALSVAFGRDFTREAQLAEDRSTIERKAEEVLSQEELAPKRWANRLAPEDLPQFAGFELGRVYQPGTGVMAGDFFDVFRVAPSRIAAVIGDVTGRGIEASITAFQAKYLLRVFLRQYRDPAQALEELNTQMLAPERTEEFISLVVVVFDTDAGTLRFASAGHPAAWLWHERDVRLPQPRDPAERRGPVAALYRRPGRGAQRRADLRRGADRQLVAPRPWGGGGRAVQEPARGGAGLRLRAARRRRGGAGDPTHVTESLS